MSDFENLSLRFPESPSSLSVSEVARMIDGVNDVYELLVIAELPGYEKYPAPSVLRPRRYSRLISDDQLRMDRLNYGSPFEVVLAALNTPVGGATALGGLFTLLRYGPGAYVDLFTMRQAQRTKLAELRAQEERAKADVAELERVDRRARRSAQEAFRYNDRASARGGADGNPPPVGGPGIAELIDATVTEVRDVLGPAERARRKARRRGRPTFNAEES